MLLLDELDDMLEFEDDWLDDELDEAIDDLLLFEASSIDLASDLKGPNIHRSCNKVLCNKKSVKALFLTARKSVNSAIKLLNSVSSSSKTKEKIR